jgi:predicted nucleic acid-binding protein
LRTALDSSVVLDVLRGGAEHAHAARAALRAAVDQGALVACDVVWAEVRASLRDTPTFQQVMDVLGVEFEAMQAEAAELAGRLWSDHHRKRRVQGAARTRILPDFLIGAHAMLRADALLTRDRGFYRQMFEGLKIIEP